MEPRHVLGAMIPLRIDGELHVPYLSMGQFYRKNDGIVNPKIPLLTNISNHLRLFSVECYKFLPQFDLRDSYGEYF